MVKRIVSFFADVFSKDYIEIDEETYCEEATVENDGEDYVLLRNVAAPSDIQIRRVCEYCEAVDNEAELRSALEKFKLQRQRANKAYRQRRLAFDITIFALTVVAIVGNSWIIRRWEHSEFAHELICYGLLAASLCIVNHHLPTRKSLATFSITALGLAMIFTAAVFFLNNWWHYLHENTRFYRNCSDGWYWPYSAVLKSDIQYSVGIGKFRYWIVFFTALVGLFADTAFMSFLRRVMKKSNALT